jgi:hypothetical protein
MSEKRSTLQAGEAKVFCRTTLLAKQRSHDVPRLLIKGEATCQMSSITAQLAGNEVVYSVVLNKARKPLSRSPAAWQ